ncbi:trypco2 family protein [Telluria beijingensis]|uniref:trypco2 family protein n=1 Tax=Telluria beijingensis TaxID=3068633 RepID=UPI00279629D2|nr:trypco2 family protein [Massilia sp. REN29]
MARFELADVLQHISTQLQEADRAARQRGAPVMQFEECEVEFAVKVEASGSAGLKVWVMEFGAAAKREQANTIRVKYKAIPGQAMQASQTVLDLPPPAPAIVRQSGKKARSSANNSE